MIGERLGKWVIFKELGRGGMGTVFLAQEEIGGRQAALKVLAPDLAQEAGFLHRFQREIDSLRILSHPGIVSFFEAGLENGHYYYAMEYVEGSNLEEIWLEQGKLPWAEVLDIARQVCSALRHVHDHGIIHRDIKPPNLLRANDGKIKLTDFGIAKVFASAHLTATGGVVGTAEFLSPEQAAGKPVTKRSDLYSLGIVLYALLTGRTPFAAASTVEMLHKHLYGQFDRPQKIVPDLPYEIDELVCNLLDKDPAQRPADCQVLGKAIERLQRRLERKNEQTQAGNPREGTVAENRAEGDFGGPGPATLMSQLVRQELESQMHGGLSGKLNRFWILAPMLALIIGILVWTFWPENMETLYARGADLMKTQRLRDMETAWRDFLDPLQQRFPDHPYQVEVAGFKEQLDTARTGKSSEAERFFHQGQRLLEEGHTREARDKWRQVVVAFSGVEAEKPWVGKAERALGELEKNAASKERLLGIQPALERAAQFRDRGKMPEAEAIWQALTELYRNEPGGEAVVRAVEGARKK
jgi:serine/threonine-protein kinase